ncbi:zinc-binding dehydrogenase [Gordonia humi]|uniref:NADPH:quinone reductase-like Zn-dependent oxidoreductase n=1 Tax=Gordonia humi TaxID=686429 RepID=A0A840EXV1_9ACTN|nr:NADPH:quinone reductase-like Zn-dependent oxidoreductase [Gordonia humi]
MRAAVCRSYGPPETLVIGEYPDPEPGPDDVVVAVRAAAVNFPDVLVMANEYQRSTALPYVPGSEFAGVVVRGGEDVGLVPGDRVYGTVPVGAFAEYVCLPATRVQRIPAAVDFKTAAGFGVAYTTAYHAVAQASAPVADTWIVVLGAAGGVGLATVDLATSMGARVIAVAAGTEKTSLCSSRGAVGVIDSRTEDLKQRIREITGDGAHTIIDPVGGQQSEQALRALRRRGVFVTVGYASGEIPSIPLNLVLLKGVTITSVDVGTLPVHDPAAESRGRAALADLLASGAVQPHVQQTYPLTAAAEALRQVADRRAIGKVVIDV